MFNIGDRVKVHCKCPLSRCRYRNYSGLIVRTTKDGSATTIYQVGEEPRNVSNEQHTNYFYAYEMMRAEDIAIKSHMPEWF